MPNMRDRKRGANSRSQLHRRVTLADVSDALGMNKSTVSRALNDYSDISETTRTRVRKMSDQMGYRPLSSAQAIRTGHSRSLGLVIQLADHDAHRPFLAEFLAGLSRGASAKGWTLTVATADTPEATTDTIKTMIKDGKADGFVLARTLLDDARITLMRRENIPFVLFGRSLDPVGCAWHDVLSEDAMRDAVLRLANLGHTKIGFINGGMHYTYGPLRLEGFRAGLSQAGLSCDAAHIKQGALTQSDGQAAAREILLTDEPPTAIVCALDTVALGVYRAAQELGLDIKRDISIIGYDGTPEGAQVSPQLSTFFVDHTESGCRLSDLLIRRIKGEDLSALRELVPATFKDGGPDGGSIAPPSKNSAELARHIARTN